MIRQLPDQIVITEISLSGVSQKRATVSASRRDAATVSDSALKVVFSYYPVCRCQRTSRSRTFQTTKKLGGKINEGYEAVHLLIV